MYDMYNIRTGARNVDPLYLRHSAHSTLFWGVGNIEIYCILSFDKHTHTLQQASRDVREVFCGAHHIIPVFVYLVYIYTDKR